MGMGAGGGKGRETPTMDRQHSLVQLERLCYNGYNNLMLRDTWPSRPLLARGQQRTVATRGKDTSTLQRLRRPGVTEQHWMRDAGQRECGGCARRAIKLFWRGVLCFRAGLLRFGRWAVNKDKVVRARATKLEKLALERLAALRNVRTSERLRQLIREAAQREGVWSTDGASDLQKAA